MRKRMLAIVLGVLVFSLVAASAASLGGLDVSDVGSEARVVASCDTDGVDVDFTTGYQGGAYVVTEVVLGDVDCPTGSDVSVTVEAGAVTETAAGTVTGTTVTLALDNAVSAEGLGNVAVLITG